MIVGAAAVEIHIHGARSLKEKRGVVRSIAQRLRNRFNVSVAEVGGLGTWQHAVLGVTAAGADASNSSGPLIVAVRPARRSGRCQISGSPTRRLRPTGRPVAA